MVDASRVSAETHEAWMRRARRVLMAFGATTPYLVWTLLQSTPAGCTMAAYRAGYEDAQFAAAAGGGGAAKMTAAMTPDGTWFCGFLYPDATLFAMVVLAAVAYALFWAYTRSERTLTEVAES